MIQGGSQQRLHFAKFNAGEDEVVLLSWWSFTCVRHWCWTQASQSSSALMHLHYTTSEHAWPRAGVHCIQPSKSVQRGKRSPRAQSSSLAVLWVCFTLGEPLGTFKELSGDLPLRELKPGQTPRLVGHHVLPAYRGWGGRPQPLMLCDISVL